MNKLNPTFAYFGGEPIGVPVLETLIAHGLKPSLVITNPDRPSGRGQKLTPPPLKVTAADHNIPVWQPENFNDKEAATQKLQGCDLFVVIAYNKILPEWLIELPPHKTLNLHPSILPLRRGPNPIRSAIVEDDRASIGASIIRMDKDMDHGPLLAQEPFTVSDSEWPIDGRELDKQLAQYGGDLLVKTISKWISGGITPREQQHADATFTKKIKRQDGELSIDPHNLPEGDEARAMLCKIRGYAGWPGTYFFYKNKRIKITKAELCDGKLRLIAVVPEGKSETSFDAVLNEHF